MKSYSFKFLLLFISVLLSGFVTEAIAETKIGFVNTARILKEAPQAELARKKLENEFAPRDKKIVQMQKDVKKLEDELTKSTEGMSDVVRKKKERQIISDKRDIKRAKEEFNEDLNIRRNDELSKLQKLVYENIVAVSQNENYDLVLGDSVIYKSKRVDLTELVLERLRAQYKAAHPNNNNLQ